MSETPTNKPPLEIAGLGFSYPDKQGILGGIDLVIESGERVGVIGPNGAGKTTLFLLACGVLKPAAGTISLFGKPVSPGEFHPEVGLVFQNPDDQLFTPSVSDDVAFGPSNMGLCREEITARTEEALSIAGVTDLADRPPHHLSGGEKRMVSIASVLSMRPELMIYDEPSAGLDLRARRRLIRFLQSAPEATLIASHDLELVLEVCDRTILIDEGEIIANGNPREIMCDGALMEAHGLEKPHSLLPHSELHHRS